MENGGKPQRTAMRGKKDFMENVSDLLSYKNIKMHGTMDDYVRFVTESQLKSRERWKKLIQPFSTREDSDGFWRGEFFGKEMRGAALIYTYSGDEELYSVLEEAAKEVLATQDELGRISTYSVGSEFNGWDLWCRKYVTTGLQHFYRICKSEDLKKRIISALEKHIDYIISKIGDEKEGKKNITTTSSWWGCVNSCTILEPTLELYRETGEERYMTFAKYIIGTGGSSDCNFLELALENKLFPYQYPVVKAYETMSFFEGLLAYYEITGEEKYFTAVKNFIEAVQKSDITIIGCAGCTHELFDNAVVKQTEFSEQIMQETCVTVTYMRLCLRLYEQTGDCKYIDRIEISGFNSLYGSVNTEHNSIRNLLDKKDVYGMTFDSYSPLYMNTRGRGTGGYMEFAGGNSCGCCEAIGACGIALMPLVAVTRYEKGLAINYLFNGEIKTKDEAGKEVTLKFASEYPASDCGKITVECETSAKLELYIRCPEYCKTRINGKETEKGYRKLAGEFKRGEEIKIEYENALKVHRLNGKVAFTYGAITLAGDEEKSDRKLELPVKVSDNPKYEELTPQKGETKRLLVTLETGEKLLLTDYASCGKKWKGEKNRITAWFNA